MKCQRKYYYYKVERAEKDPDFEENWDAFNMGKAFHKALEDTLHVFRDCKEHMTICQKACRENDIKDSSTMARVYAMCVIYSVLHRESGLKVVAVEPEVKLEYFIGFVDAVMADNEGYWWIVDLKTTGRFDKHLQASMSNNMQLNIYSAMASDLAQRFELDVGKFAGIRYRATTKPTVKPNSNERFKEYCERLIDSGRIRSYDIPVEMSRLTPVAHMAELKNAFEAIQQGRKLGPGRFRRNYNSCIDYSRPCEYWSKCHKKTYTDCKDSTLIYDQDSMPNVNDVRSEEMPNRFPTYTEDDDDIIFV